MIRQITQRSFILLSILILAGCSLFSPAKVNVPNKYLLNKLPDDVVTKKKHSVVVLIQSPVTRPIYNTNQMAYSLRPYEISYFSENEWGETPAEMLQPLLVQTLQNTHYFSEIVTPPYTGKYDYVLNTQILELRQDFSHCTPYLIMSVRVQINKMPSDRVIATKQFTVVQPFKPASPYGGVYAANYASAKILKRISLFCLRVMR